MKTRTLVTSAVAIAGVVVGATLARSVSIVHGTNNVSYHGSTSSTATPAVQATGTYVFACVNKSGKIDYLEFRLPLPRQCWFSAVVVAVFSLIYGRIWLNRHRDAPLRREIRSRDVTFRAELYRVTELEPASWVPGSDFEVPISSPVQLIIRGDAFEISSVRSFGRVVMGLEYFFRAPETSVELNRPIPRIYGKDKPPRIILRGWRAGKKIQLTIRQKNDPLEIWNALTGAGAVPGNTWIDPAIRA